MAVFSAYFSNGYRMKAAKNGLRGVASGRRIFCHLLEQGFCSTSPFGRAKKRPATPSEVLSFHNNYGLH